MGMEEEEVSALFDVLASLIDDPDWPEMHPTPCTDTPWPGVQCEIDDQSLLFHVTKIHIAPDIVNPPCKTSASFSTSFLKLPYLKVLSIFNCFVASPATLPPSLFHASSSLEHLALNSNPNLSGSIPSTLGHIPSLRVLSLSQNNLHGSIPVELGSLVNLEQLDLSYNNLTGEIPEELGELERLEILDLSWNGLQGEVPPSIGQLKVLQKLDLSYNNIVGTIPSELGKLNRLVLLDLSHNFMNGPIPETFSGLEKLEYLILNHNPLNSGIPLFVGSLKCLITISLSASRLKGPIPNSVCSLKNLSALSLDNNSLSGTIPSNLGLLPNLNQLNLSNNELSGEVLLAEKFIERLGRRLDVRGNRGLCTSNKKKKNISIYVETPNCLGKIGNENQNADENKGMQSSLYHGKISSSSLNQECSVRYLLLWIKWIMLCVTSVRYSIKVNDKIMGPFSPRRGLRQGDPLSPYLFLLCVEGLSALVSDAEKRGMIHGSRVCRRAPAVSHLLFADDAFLFVRANIGECRELKRLLNIYEEASGQAINFTKSGILCSCNVNPLLVEGIQFILEVYQPIDTGRYLGLPSLVGRKKKVIFAHLKDRLWKKLQN
ncbi:receptor like protein 29-like [Euphorbia lathyris]|uniref:receptor like protein 29-like n=1 Tax=Euphorbia lathyris TaxID=212925 RepID=UPI0033138B8F